MNVHRPARSRGVRLTRAWLLVALCVLMVSACGRPTPSPAPTAAPTLRAAQEEVATPTPAAPTAVPPTPTLAPSPTPLPEPVAVYLSEATPPDIAEDVRLGLERWASAPASGAPRVVAEAESSEEARIVIEALPLADSAPEAGEEFVLATRYYAVVAPFDTLTDNIALREIEGRWVGLSSSGFLYTTPEAAPALTLLFGDQTLATVVPAEEMHARLSEDRNAVGVLPFDRLDPRFKVLTVDGVNVLSNTLDPLSYPLAVAVVARGPEAEDALAPLTAAISPATNRDGDLLTTLIMTGVTAMSRGTAARMEAMGYDYPAKIIAGELSAADITHVSNEVPFIDGCPVNNTEGNLTLCSDYTYWAALEAIGTDIVGLSGNHVNDFGRDGARESLQFYRDRGIPIYGSGLNTEEACAPLMWEHNGNTFAFLAALAFDPAYAWASDTEPGACYFYDHKDAILQSIAELSAKVDIVAVELQYLETYVPYPTDQQVAEFRELRAAGADIVTGVQSHVPQAMEPYGEEEPGGSGVIVYGLGNLFFDQMWSWETRTELYARHTLYDGRVLSTEILTGVLEDYAQPRWATPEERHEILGRIFEAAPPRPGSSDVVATAVSTATPEAAWTAIEEPALRVRLEIPASWQPVMGYDRRYGGDDGFVQLSAVNGEGMGIGEVCNLHSKHELQPYGSAPSVETLTVSGQQACLIHPSGDQPAEMEAQAALLVTLPAPVTLDDEAYHYLVLWADAEHIARIAEGLVLAS